MKNLQLLTSQVIPDLHGFENCHHLSIDCDARIIFGATDTEVVAFDLSKRTVVGQVSLLEHGFLQPDNSSHVVSIQHLLDQFALCIATSKGDVLMWNKDLSLESCLECVGAVESGITAMAWSPDFEIVTLVTGAGSVVLMTRDFDPVAEFPIQQSEFGEAELITVGWGKKETQFHGSEGKQAAHKQTESVGLALSWDDRKPRVTWRGDGLFFAITTINLDTGCRQFRVWSREGVLHSTSAPVPGLGQALSYKPSGSLIASSKVKQNEHSITFFEKNGLPHGEFLLPFKADDIKVLDVFWNLDSTILAVWCEDRVPDNCEEESTAKSYVQLWTSSNYHWYLKQSLDFKWSSRVTSLMWDPENAYCLHIVCVGGLYFQYTWTFNITHSCGMSAEDPVSVAVIDGAKVLITPFRTMVIPPPMCAYHLQLPAPVSIVTFGKGESSNDLAVLTNDGQLNIYEFNNEGENINAATATDAVKVDEAGGNGFNVKCRLHKLKTQVRISDDSFHHLASFHHLTWLNKDSFLFSSTSEKGDQTLQLIVLNFDLATVHTKHCTGVSGTVVAINQSLDSDSVAVQLNDGSCLRYSPVDGSVIPWCTSTGSLQRFPQVCSQMAVFQIGGKEVLVGLTERFRFYVENAEVANDCTSFTIHDEFLILTTHSHTCLCISRRTPVDALNLKNLNGVSDETIRRIERGSKLICTVPCDTKVVLQAPRGNLEVIHPRALVLFLVRRYLDNVQFGEAFKLAKKHRINMNLLYDHNPSTFLSNSSVFIRQLGSSNNINLFLTDLHEEDVTLTMYTSAYTQRPHPVRSALGQQSKLDTICDNLRHALEEEPDNKYVLSVLTTFVKKSVPDLESALKKIRGLKEDSNAKVVSSEEALKYLLYLVDVNRLYEVALGMYDFDMVLMVAEKSQKDPKEYLPYLNDLRKLEINFQRYTIDVQLKRYSKALTHICKCGPSQFPACLELVKQHGLYTEAFNLYDICSKEYKDLTVLYGDHLEERNRWEEAGLIYARGRQFAKSLEMFEKSLNWQMAICMAIRLEKNPLEIIKLSRGLAVKLVEAHRHLEAATLLEQHCNDSEEAIATLISGCQWNEALRLIHKYQRYDIIETNFKPALLESLACHLTSIDRTRSDFERHRTRLDVVREAKRTKEIYDDFEGNRAEEDLYSDTSSVTGDSVMSGQTGRSVADSKRSQYSRTTGRTAKSRQKREKKRWSLKEGSPFEEFALVEALHKIINQVESWKDDINGLLRVLVLYNFLRQATDLQTKLDSFTKELEKSIPDIWKLDASGTIQNNLVLGPNSTTNSITQAALQQKQESTTAPSAADSILFTPPVINKDRIWKLKMLD